MLMTVYSYQTYTGDGVTANFAFTVPYINQSDVSVFVAGISVSFTWLNSTTVTPTVVPANGAAIKIVRSTQKQTAAVTFQDGSTLGKTDLNTADTQLLYISQEAFDTAATNLGLGADNQYTAGGLRIENVADPVGTQDVVTLNRLNSVVVTAGNVPAPGSSIGTPSYWLRATGAATWAWAKIVAADINAFFGASITIDSAGALGAQLHGSCIFSYVDATHCKLTPKDGGFLRIAGKVCSIPSAGVSVDTTGLSVSTLYYAYAKDANADGVIDAIEWSTTGHSTDATAGNVGVEIKTGDNTRTLVGMAYVNSSTQFDDSAAKRNVASYFNHKRKQGLGTFGNGTATSSGTFVDLGSSFYLEITSWLDHPPLIGVFGYLLNTVSGNSTGVSIGDGNATSIFPGSTSGLLSTAPANNAIEPGSGMFVYPATEGRHQYRMLGLVGGGSGGFYTSLTALVRN